MHATFHARSNSSSDAAMMVRRGLAALLLAFALLPLGEVVAPVSATVANAAGREPLYEIAFVGPISGSARRFTLNLEDAARLAVNNANASHQLRFQLRLVAYDTKGNSDIRAALLHRLVANKRVVAVIGPTSPDGVQEAGPILSRARVAMVTPTVTTPSLATLGFANFFRDVPDDTVQGAADADFLVRALGSQRLFVVSDASVYGNTLSSAVSARATVDGASVVNQSAPITSNCGGTASATEYASVALAALASQATSLFYGGLNCDFGLLLDALNNVGFHGVVLSDDGANANELLSATASISAADGVYLSCGCVTSTNATFNREFASLAHVSASSASYAVESYDAANAIINALRTLKVVTRAALVNALHRVTVHGISRTFRFQANGNMTGTSVFISQVQGHQIAPLGFA
ncbi:MAG: hypothetical protein B7X07_01040 [Actinobacteria bacterium 21-64-8]|nr:MAG: hypothetical protein B7X07_01040 [Actinobacteria bacterium 21-64-8]